MSYVRRFGVSDRRASTRVSSPFDLPRNASILIRLNSFRAAPIFVYADMNTGASLQRVDLLFRAFSDRTRLRILNLLAGGELCVCDLVDVLKVPQPKASRHLAYLRKAGLVTVRKDGYWSYYQLAPASNAFHQKLLDCISCCFQEVPELAKDSKTLRLRQRCCE